MSNYRIPHVSLLQSQSVYCALIYAIEYMFRLIPLQTMPRDWKVGRLLKLAPVLESIGSAVGGYADS